MLVNVSLSAFHLKSHTRHPQPRPLPSRASTVLPSTALFATSAHHSNAPSLSGLELPPCFFGVLERWACVPPTTLPNQPRTMSLRNKRAQDSIRPEKRYGRGSAPRKRRRVHKQHASGVC